MRFLNTNKKKNLLVFLFAFFIVVSGLFLADVQTASAGRCEDQSGIIPDGGCLALDGLSYVVGGVAGYIGDGLVWAFKWVLFGFFQLLGWLASVAITLFGWAVKPGYISGDGGLLNLPAIYNMWQFVRDFFNIFFIFVLLYIAFTTVFQIQKNFKKAILTLVLAALFVNFSFPISRVLIDVTNVPMYFFANQMLGSDGNVDVLGSALSASQLSGILVPGSQAGEEFDTGKTTVSRLLAAIVFMFLFSVTLIVLAVMFVIRLVALVILVIFSSAGFVALIVPGMEKYGKMWWDNFWKYALFGPAAMLMLLVATRFFDAIGNKNGATFGGIKRVASDVASEPDFIASMAMFSIPIIMLWFAMGLGQKFSIAGAATISGKGEKFAKWMGGKASGYNALKRNYGSYAAARKKREDEKNKNNLGARLGKTFNKKQDTIYGATGLPWSKAARQRVQDMQNKEIYEKAEENKKNGVSDPELRAQLHSGDKTKAAAAAISLSERGAIDSANDFSAALTALGNNTKEVSALIEKAGEGAVGGLSGAQYGNVMNSTTLSGNANLQKKFESKVKKEGGAKAVVEYKVSRAPGGATPANQQAAVEGVLLSMKSSKDVAASESLFADPTYGAHAVAYVKDRTKTTAEREQAIKKASAEDGTSVGGMIP